MLKLPQEYCVSVPLKSLARRPFYDSWRHPNLVAVELEVVFAVVEVLFKPAAHAELEVRCHRHVTSIKQGMYIGAQEQAVLNGVLPFGADGFDVGGFQNRQGFFPRHRTPTLVDIRHQHPEGTLPKAWKD